MHHVSVEAILEYLKATPGQAYSDRQVSRAVDWDCFREDQIWARPYLETLVRMRKLAVDRNGWFRYPASESQPLRPVPDAAQSIRLELSGARAVAPMNIPG
jgi:hypothetical protein